MSADADTIKPKATTMRPPPEDEKPKSAKKPADKPKAEKADKSPREPGVTGQTKTRGRPPELQKQVEDFFLNIALLVSPLNQADGQIIAKNAEQLAESWCKLAKQNKTVDAYLRRLVTGGAWGGAIASTLGLIMAIAVNHGFMADHPVGAMMAASMAEDIPAFEPPPPPGI